MYRCEKHNNESLFSTPVWGYIVDNHHYQTFDYLDYILELKKNTPNNSLNWSSSYNLHHHGIFKEFETFLLQLSKEILRSYTNNNLKVSEMWATVNDKYFYNAHNSILSGIFFINVPANSGNLVLNNPVVKSENHLIRNQDFSIRPERLALILFPSWLEYYVEPNKSDEQRVSISFNIGEKL